VIESDSSGLIRAVEQLSRIQLIRLTHEAAEFLTTTDCWVDIVATSTAWRVRVYYRGRFQERTAPDVLSVLDEARQLSRRSAWG
jgi:hypothetical protein